MTVSSSTNKASYNGNGSTTVFAYNFKIFDQDDLTVIIRSATGTETVKTITTDYTVSGVGNDGGGNVTMGTAPASGETITILREQDLVQELYLVPNDPFPANLMEDALDRLTFMVQQHDEELARSIKASKTNTITSTEFTVSAADRANKIFAFDSSGELAVTQELGTYRGNWATSTAFAQRDIVKDTSNNNIYICLVAHTSTGAQPITSNADVAKWALLVDAASATTSASAAASSASAAATSATNAANSASAASTSAGNAATSESNASTSASAAATSATNASNSATAAAGSASAASTSETNAASSASAASTSASNAATSASNAATSETNAANSASAASTSETNAASSASAASTSASNAATSATNASNSASAAATSASNASTSETNAANSASAASGSATSAANSAAAAAASFDSFDDRYLGVKASDPTLDNDGNALVAGALYFSSSENIMKVYDGASWIAATSAGNVSLLQYEYTATLGQTTFSGADDNSATLSYTVNNLIVTLNGVVLDNGGDYTATNGTSVVLTSGAAAGDLLQVIAFKSFTVADMVPASTGGTFSGNVAVNGNLTVDTNTLFVDAANNRVGVGTTSPTATLTAVTGVSGNNEGEIRVSDNASFYGSLSRVNASDEVRLGSYGASQNLTFYTVASERMRITSAGLVGVGTSSPQKSLVVSDGGAMGVEISPDDAGQGYSRILNFNRATSEYEPLYIEAEDLIFSTGVSAAERARIDASGALLVGTTVSYSSSYRMSIAPPAGTGGIIFKNFAGTNSGAPYAFLNTSDALVGSITTSASSTAFNTSSDYRLKENVVPLAGAADRLMQIPVCRFNFIADPDKTVDGFLAHEVQAFVPECVTGEKDQVETVEVTDEDGNVIGTEERPVYQGIDQSKLVPLLTSALQEALARIETLEADVAALKGEPA